jgi:hypothetical protein
MGRLRITFVKLEVRNKIAILVSEPVVGAAGINFFPRRQQIRALGRKKSRRNNSLFYNIRVF